MSKCIDSDGVNYNSKGNVSITNSSGSFFVEDSCSENNLTEMVCNSDGTASKVNYVCDYGCSDGKCNSNINNKNAFVVYGDFDSSDFTDLSKAFYAQHPEDDYDFLYFFHHTSYNNAWSVPAQSDGMFLKNSSGFNKFDNTLAYGSSGNLLHVVVDEVPINNLDRSGFMDTLFFGVMQHELFHYWGIFLPDKLNDAACDSGHWKGYVGSRLSCGGDSNTKFVQNGQNYSFIYNCSGTPKFHDFELYAMGLKSAEQVEDKIVIYNPDKYYVNEISHIDDCEKVNFVPSEDILKSYSVQDFIDVVGPASSEFKNNFKIAFILIKPIGSEVSNDEVNFLNWWSNKAPIAWFRSTEGLSTLNNNIPQNNDLPVITNVQIQNDSSKIIVSWNTNKPSIGAIFIKHSVAGFTKMIYDPISIAPNYSLIHSIVITADNDPNIMYDGVKNIVVNRILSVDEDLNVGNWIFEKECSDGKCNSNPAPSQSGGGGGGGGNGGSSRRITSTSTTTTTPAVSSTPSSTSSSNNNPSEETTDETKPECSENSECTSNLCLNGECVQIDSSNGNRNQWRGLVEILCKIINPVDKKSYNNCIRFLIG